jgi:PAS domain S-box-containing protein
MDILDILANTADGVFAIGTDQRIILWNKGAQAILGFSSKEVLGNNCYDVIAGRDESGNLVCSKDCWIVNHIQKGEMVTNHDMLTHSKAGDPVWINVSMVVIPGRRKQFNTVVHIFRDITKRKHSEELIQELISTVKRSNQAKEHTLSAKISPLDNQSKTRLTRRERQVLILLAEGASTNTITEELYISRATARKHIQNILTKLRLHTKLEAVIYATKNNLI